MKYTPILGTLGFILSPDKQKVLLVHRIHREDDDQLGKYNGLGGKMEPNEDVVSCMKREIMEEAGITCTEMSLRGTINWTGFGPNGEDWLGFIFLIEAFEGTPYSKNEEGPLEWVDIALLDTLPMCTGVNMMQFCYDSGAILDKDGNKLTEIGTGSCEIPMWEGDRYFIPLVFDNDPRLFHGYMPYDGERPVSWSYQRI